MTHDVAPAADDLLCENCGYLLNGLPAEGNCPECGMAVSASTTASNRILPAWESGTDNAAGRFQATSFAVLLHPNHFYRTLSVRGDEARSRRLAILLLVPIVVVCSKTIILHYFITFKLSVPPQWLNPIMMMPLVPIFVAVVWIAMYFAVVHLTVIEAKYWGFRLRINVVQRALHYLSVHVLVAALLPLVVVTIYLFMLLGNERYFGLHMVEYLYALSGSIVVSALYLFNRYWKAMRAIMNANV